MGERVIGATNIERPNSSPKTAPDNRALQTPRLSLKEADTKKIEEISRMQLENLTNTYFELLAKYPDIDQEGEMNEVVARMDQNDKQVQSWLNQRKTFDSAVGIEKKRIHLENQKEGDDETTENEVLRSVVSENLAQIDELQHSIDFLSKKTTSLEKEKEFILELLEENSFEEAKRASEHLVKKLERKQKQLKAEQKENEALQTMLDEITFRMEHRKEFGTNTNEKKLQRVPELKKEMEAAMLTDKQQAHDIGEYLLDLLQSSTRDDQTLSGEDAVEDNENRKAHFLGEVQAALQNSSVRPEDIEGNLHDLQELLNQNRFDKAVDLKNDILQHIYAADKKFVAGNEVPVEDDENDWKLDRINAMLNGIDVRLKTTKKIIPETSLKAIQRMQKEIIALAQKQQFDEAMAKAEKLSYDLVEFYPKPNEFPRDFVGPAVEPIPAQTIILNETLDRKNQAKKVETKIASKPRRRRVTNQEPKGDYFEGSVPTRVEPEETNFEGMSPEEIMQMNSLAPRKESLEIETSPIEKAFFERDKESIAQAEREAFENSRNTKKKGFLSGILERLGFKKSPEQIFELYQREQEKEHQRWLREISKMSLQEMIQRIADFGIIVKPNGKIAPAEVEKVKALLAEKTPRGEIFQKLYTRAAEVQKQIRRPS